VIHKLKFNTNLHQMSSNFRAWVRTRFYRKGWFTKHYASQI